MIKTKILTHLKHIGALQALPVVVMHLMKQKSIMQMKNIINALLGKLVRIKYLKKKKKLSIFPHAPNYLKLHFTATVLKALLER